MWQPAHLLVSHPTAGGRVGARTNWHWTAATLPRRHGGGWALHHPRTPISSTSADTRAQSHASFPALTSAGRQSGPRRGCVPCSLPNVATGTSAAGSVPYSRAPSGASQQSLQSVWGAEYVYAATVVQGLGLFTDDLVPNGLSIAADEILLPVGQGAHLATAR